MSGLRIAACLTLVAFFLGVAAGTPAAAQEGTFIASLKEGGKEEALSGEAGYMPLPSMFSVYLDAQNGRCAFHLSGFSSPPSEGSFPVESDDSLKVRALCIFEDREPRERLLAEQGELTITERSTGRISGRFDFVLHGGVTGKEYALEGSFSSTLKTSI